MVKDKISLIAAAAGGFMLFVALSGILQGSPVTALRAQDGFGSAKVADSQLQKVHADLHFVPFSKSSKKPGF